MFSVGNRVTNNVLKENLQHTTSLLIDETRYTLYTAATGKTANGGFRNTLNVIAKDLSVTLGASLSESFSTFSTACVEIQYKQRWVRRERKERIAAMADQYDDFS
jgi:hypothetical protein